MPRGVNEVGTWAGPDRRVIGCRGVVVLVVGTERAVYCCSMVVQAERLVRSGERAAGSIAALNDQAISGSRHG